MNNQQAIEELRHDCNELGKSIPYDTGWGVTFNEAYGMAISALEKQIPKKPLNIIKSRLSPLHCVDGFYGNCPCCGGNLKSHGTVERFCPYCGQAVDWGKL